MLRRPVARWAGLSLAAASALMLAAAPPGAAPAAVVGDVQVTLKSPGDGGRLIGAPIKVIKSPGDGRCYTLQEVFPDAPAGSSFGSVANQTSTSVFLYEGENCSGAAWDPTPLSPGMVVTGAPLHSFKIKPGPALDVPPANP